MTTELPNRAYEPPYGIFTLKIRYRTMAWTKKDYPDSLKNLDARVRNKAIEIANALVEEQDMEESKAIPIATSKAKEWAENHS
jgi:hypothetical protein